MNDNIDWNENNHFVWELLAVKNDYLSIGDISKQLGLEDHESRISISKLLKYDIIEKKINNEKALYRIITVLKALQWARAVELGIDIESLEKFAKLDTSKEEALKVTMDGSLEEHEENIQKEKMQKRHNYLEGKAATEAAKTDLAKIVSDTKSAMDSKSNNKFVNALLKTANEEAEHALQTLINSYIKQRS